MNERKTVLVAGSTGYLGRFLVAEYVKRGWKVKALVRSLPQKPFPVGTEVVVAQATVPQTLQNVMNDVDLVISALGITRQRDGLTYRDVDYQANMNLLAEALRASVERFAYVHVLHGNELAHLTPIAAKQDFVNELKAATIASTIIAPSGFFSDMRDFLDMAKQGRVWLFGDGSKRMNPIHGEDLANTAADAIEDKLEHIDVGGPDVLSHTEIAEMAFECVGKPVKISFIWDSIRRFLVAVVPWITPSYIGGPAQFFLTAMGMDMVGECHGEHHLRDHFKQLVEETKQYPEN